MEIIHGTRNIDYYLELVRTWVLEENLLLYLSRIISNLTLKFILINRDNHMFHPLSKKLLFAINRNCYKKPEFIIK